MAKSTSSRKAGKSVSKSEKSMPATVTEDSRGVPIYPGSVVAITSRIGTEDGGVVVRICGDSITYQNLDGELETGLASELYTVVRGKHYADGVIVGSLCVIDGPTVAQVIHRNGNAVIVVPLVDDHGKVHPADAEPIDWDAADCTPLPALRLLPPLLA